ncbi:L-lactate dehydrogenase [Papillibacter cinnamivorans]|uniref:L-lactate dehydrogenase n=1 Tax=Papillibacter cinnamivorans TaxID=100176 RepID=UPI0009FE7FC4|nr:L-lactate dehydrogenase [Papillibacter cinnamivorans]
MNKKRIVIIGAGHVGSHCASALAMEHVADEIVLIDCDAPKAAAQAMDVSDSISFMQSPVVVRGGDYSDCAGAEIAVVSVGKPRLPGQSRLDMLDDSIVMVRDVAAHLKEAAFDGIVISITNPADVIADCIRKELGKPRRQVFSTGTLLDTARLLRTLSELTGIDRRSISAISMGEHGDSSMIPFSCVTVGGIPFERLEDISKEHVLERTRNIGIDIINAKGSTEFGIGFALAAMARAILNDEKRVMPVSVLLEGEYGITGVHCGVPAVIGRSGVERIVEISLSPDESEQLKHSCQIIQQYVERADHLPRM